MSRAAPASRPASTATVGGSPRACPTSGDGRRGDRFVKARTVRIWCAVHTWTSLISTLFLFLLCLTGLPLIFHHEIDELLGYAPQPEVHAGEKATTQRIAASALAADPGRVLQYISWDKDEPGIVFAFTNSAPNGEPDKATVRAFDAVTTKMLGPV